jgi:hypothetical protein
MARSDDDPLRVVLTKIVPESLPLGGRLRLLKQLMMNSMLPKRIVLPREKSSHVKRSQLVATVSVDV